MQGERLDDLRIKEIRPLESPAKVRAKYPLDDGAAATVRETRLGLRDIIHGRDERRMAAIVGPCSIHDPEAALDYAARLKRVADDLRGELVVLMRAYFEKPRTTVGWKGLINDPHLDGSCDVAAGLEKARALLLKINALGVGCATEFLEPITPQYIADLVSWAAIGARTTESQTHRQMASGLSMPVGFKNGIDGGLQTALNALVSARQPHSFLGINSVGLTAIVKTTGNPDCHIVLRGGESRTNYGSEDVERAATLASEGGVTRPVLVDCSHGNSAKDPTRQGVAWRDVLEQFRAGEGRLMGLTLESNLKPGKQVWKEGARLEYGVSITDGCIGWDETETLLREMAETVREAGARAAKSGG
ncbi:MAG: 3-deoxy-7-phosphoheptulonate synthase [Planctomycetota bacterium]|nr:3-deoxy-7-phosphoheptulonate synthase [Planctomycetota bacterium]